MRKRVCKRGGKLVRFRRAERLTARRQDGGERAAERGVCGLGDRLQRCLDRVELKIARELLACAQECLLVLDAPSFALELRRR